MARSHLFLSAIPLLFATVAHSTPPTLVLDRHVGHLYFYTGSIELEGIVERRSDQETLEIAGDNLCFFVSPKSRNRIPRDKDQREAWFCFSDMEATVRTMHLPPAPTGGTCGYSIPATVVVGNYVVDRRESAVHDTASLMLVKNIGALRSIPCK